MKTCSLGVLENHIVKIGAAVVFGVTGLAGVLPAKKAHLYPVPIPLTKTVPEIISNIQIQQDWQLPIWVRPRFDDATYAKLDHDRLPLLLDWLDQTVAHLKERQLKQDDTPMVHNVRHARLLRVMAGVTLRYDKSFPAAAVLIGFVQLSLDDAWGERQAGDVVELMLVGTDRGYFLIDPATRTMRPYDETLQLLTKWVHL